MQEINVKDIQSGVRRCGPDVQAWDLNSDSQKFIKTWVLFCGRNLSAEKADIGGSKEVEGEPV